VETYSAVFKKKNLPKKVKEITFFDLQLAHNINELIICTPKEAGEVSTYWKGLLTLFKF